MSRIVSNREYIRQPSRATKKRKARDGASEWRERQPRLCPLCGERVAEHEHHIILKGMGGKRSAECNANRLLICETCHDEIHAERLPLLCVLRAKQEVDGSLDRERLEEIGGQRLWQLDYRNGGS